MPVDACLSYSLMTSQCLINLIKKFPVTGALCLIHYGVPEMNNATNGIQEPEYDEKIVYVPHDDSAGLAQLGASSSTSQPAENPTLLPKLTSQFTRGGVHGKQPPANSVPRDGMRGQMHGHLRRACHPKAICRHLSATST